jgi:hypothetical protein
VTGLGAGIYDRLQEQGFGSLVEGVNFGAKALEPDRYANRRAEMWDRKRAWYLLNCSSETSLASLPASAGCSAFHTPSTSHQASRSLRRTGLPSK